MSKNEISQGNFSGKDARCIFNSHVNKTLSVKKRSYNKSWHACCGLDENGCETPEEKKKAMGLGSERGKDRTNGRTQPKRSSRSIIPWGIIEMQGRFIDAHRASTFSRGNILSAGITFVSVIAMKLTKKMAPTTTTVLAVLLLATHLSVCRSERTHNPWTRSPKVS